MRPSNGEAGGVVVGFDAEWRMKNLLRVATDEVVRRQSALAIVTRDLTRCGSSGPRRRMSARAQRVLGSQNR